MHAAGMGSLGAGLIGSVPSVCHTAGACSGEQAHPGMLTLAYQTVLHTSVSVCVARSFVAHTRSAYHAPQYGLAANAWCWLDCDACVYWCERHHVAGMYVSNVC